MFIWPPVLAKYERINNGSYNTWRGLGQGGLFGYASNEYLYMQSGWAGSFGAFLLNIDTFAYAGNIFYVGETTNFPIGETASFELEVGSYSYAANMRTFKFRDFSAPIDLLIFRTNIEPGYEDRTAFFLSDISGITPYTFFAHPTLEFVYWASTVGAGDVHMEGVIRSSATDYWVVYGEYGEVGVDFYWFKAVKRVIGPGGYWDAPVTLKTFDRNSSTASPAESKILQVFYAGEGWAYILYTTGENDPNTPPNEDLPEGQGGAHLLMAVDFTTDPPTQHDIAIPFSYRYANDSDRPITAETSYVTIGGYRVVVFVPVGPGLGDDYDRCGHSVLVLRYTESTKATPWVTFDFVFHADYPARYIYHPRFYAIEVNPVTDEAYLITGLTSIHSTQLKTYVYLDAHNLSTITQRWADSGFVAEELATEYEATFPLSYNDTQVLWDWTGPILEPVDSWSWNNSSYAPTLASAYDGEASFSMYMHTTTYNYRDYPTRAALLFWHTPVNYECGVDSTDTYSAVSFKPVRIRNRALDTHSTYVDCLFIVNIPLEYSGTFVWEMNESGGSEKQAGVYMQDTYVEVEFGALALTMVTSVLEQYNPIIGTAWMNEFMGYVNQDRAAVGLPPYKTFGEDGKFTTRRDIANLHANNMSNLGIYEHEDPRFPAGQQTITERIGIMNAGYGAENIAIHSTVQMTEPPSLYGIPSPYDAWLGWHNSPPHYANITRDYGVDNNENAYSLIGYQEGRTPSSFPEYTDYIFAYLCNNFAVLEDQVVESTLSQYWSNEGAVIAYLAQEWSISAYTRVESEHSSVYGIRVASQMMEAEWGCRVSASLSAPITFSVQVEHTANYTSTENVIRTQHEAGYGINEYSFVSLEHASIWGLSVGAEHEVNFNYQNAVSGEFEAPFDLNALQKVSTEHGLLYSFVVSSSHSADWSMSVGVSKEHAAPYGEVVRVSAEMEHRYGVLTYNPVRKAMIHYYRLQANV